MFPAIQFGRLFGIPLRARVSFLLMLAAVLLFWGGLSGVFVVLLAFGSVILHEFGHALTARKLGVGVSSIELHFFGGVASLTSQPKSANDEALIAAAGPAVSFALAAVGYTLLAATGLGVFGLLGAVNLVIAVFNLLPALPMDGGRIFRALLSKRVGFKRATDVSVTMSRVVSIAFGVIGLAFMQLQFLLLAFVLWSMASAEKAMAQRNPYAQRGGRESPEVVPYRGPAASAERVVILRYNQRRN
jgi:Zn-dependent protease